MFQSDGTIDDYEHPVQIGDLTYSDKVSPMLSPPDDQRLSEFINKYFGEGVRPIVWLDAQHAEDLAWMILDGLWPKLRKEFSFCTLSLQPKNQADRTFDVYFAPSTVYSRFHQFDRANFVAHSPEKADNPLWQVKWKRFLTLGEPLAPGTQELFELLSGPTDIEKLFLYSELIERTNISSSAILGAMDVVESIAPESSEAESCKSYTANLAISAFDEDYRKSGEWRRLLDLTAMLDVRLAKPAFALIRPTVESRALRLVQDIILPQVESAIMFVEQLGLREGINSTSIVHRGLCQSLVALGVEDPPSLIRALSDSRYTNLWLGQAPQLFEYIFAVDNPEYSAAGQSLLNSFCRASGSEAIRTAAKKIASTLNSAKTLRMLDPMFDHLLSSDIPEVLNSFEQNPKLADDPDLRQSLRFLAFHFPEELRIWYLSHLNAKIAGQLVAFTYPISPDGLKRISDDYRNDKLTLQNIADFLQFAAGASHMPSWVVEWLGANGDVTSALFQLHLTSNLLIEIIGRRLPDLPPEMQLLVLRKICSGAEPGTLPADVQETASICLLRLGIGLHLNSEDNSLLNSSWFIDGISNAPSHSLTEIFSEHSVSRELWLRCWRWLEAAPASFYWRRDEVIVSCVGMLLFVDSSFDWQQASIAWAAVLSRLKSIGADMVYTTLCVQALRFGFSHTNLPLSPVVVASFSSVYRAMQLNKVEDWPGANSIFNIFGWDKCKVLRKNLIESYRNSDWPAKDFALSVQDTDLLARIIKRMRTEWAGTEFYLADMLRQLSSDPNCSEITASVATIIKNPNQKYDWY
jgi:hypothetical protein